MDRIIKKFSKIIDLTKSIIKSSLLAFILFGFSALFMAALLEKSEEKHFIVSWFMVLIYDIAYFIIHELDRTETHAKDDNNFSYRRELMAYFKREGVYLLLIYSICVTIVEISMIITNNAPANFFAGIFAMNFPLMPYFPMIIRSIICLSLCMISAVVMAIFRSFTLRIYS